jgi:hypothetical protein
MNNTIRTTRMCPVTQLHPLLLQTFEEYFQSHHLGDPATETLLCCETLTRKENEDKLATWLGGDPDTTQYLGLILTEDRLLWARSGNQSKIIMIGAYLRDIRLQIFVSRSGDLFELRLSGIVGDSKDRVKGNLVLGAGPDAQKFCEQAKKASDEARPPSKGLRFPWARK